MCVFNQIVSYQPTVMEKGQSSEWPLSVNYYSDIGNIDCFYSSSFDVSNLIGQTFASVSSSDSYSPAFQANKNRLERTPMNFRCRQPFPYNCNFDRIWREQVYPTQWQEAIVIPILKPGKDPKNPLSYRPIALTSCLCKTLERVVNARLVYQLEKNKCIPLFQSGFRVTEDPLSTILLHSKTKSETLLSGGII
ncbi:putative RNA-directed DNA polymerase from transposon X-element [Trichonephila clavipes]|nr:putative RNA-directed DNA polymerase from transposon X-element [Trichonephila clavipes]